MTQETTINTEEETVTQAAEAPNLWKIHYWEAKLGIDVEGDMVSIAHKHYMIIEVIKDYGQREEGQYDVENGHYGNFNQEECKIDEDYFYSWRKTGLIKASMYRECLYLTHSEKFT